MCDMQRHVSSSGQAEVLLPSTSSHSSQPKRDDEASGSMKVDPSPDPMQTILASMTKLMKQNSTMLQMMQEDRSHPREYPKPSYDQPMRYNSNEGRRNFNL